MINPMLFNATMTVQLATRSTDSMGGESETWANVADATDVPVLVKPIMAERRPLDDKKAFVYTHKIYAPNYATISESDHQILIGGTVHEIITADFTDDHWEITTKEMR